ncbi:MAG: hypothetical protein WA231_07515 [Methylocella sp.]
MKEEVTREPLTEKESRHVEWSVGKGLELVYGGQIEHRQIALHARDQTGLILPRHNGRVLRRH